MSLAQPVCAEGARLHDCLLLLYIFTCIGSDDYTSVSSMELTFRPATSTDPQCGDIQITDEDILEDDESFNVILGSSDSAVMVNPSTATVTIRNDDGKFP